MKRPTFQEFVQAAREKERIEGAKLRADGSPMFTADPLSDEQLLEMWQNIKEEPATGLEYGGEITKLT